MSGGELLSLDVLPHPLKGRHIGRREQHAFLPGHLICHHVAAFLGQQIGGEDAACDVVVGVRDEKVTHPNFGGSGFFFLPLVAR